MKVVCAATAIFLSCLGTRCLAQEATKDPPKREWRDLINTQLSGSNCTPAEGGRICKGIEGYSLLVKGDELKPEVYLLAPEGRRVQLHYWDTSDPKFQGLFDGVMWTVVHSPKSIALTFYPRIAQRDDYTYADGYDIIARVSPGSVCIVGSVPAGSTQAGESVAISSNPRPRRCLSLQEREKKDWFLTARRLANEGQFQAAMLAVAKVRTPSERFLVYGEMSVAQFKAGDPQGSRRTLIGARAQALRNPGDVTHTLGYVFYAMVDTGLYEEAKSDIKRFPEHDRLKMYLRIASVQGEKRDLEAARKTLHEAIQVELKQNPPVDWHLSEIGVAQARLGLIDEAKKTASMIRDPSLRKTVEESISGRGYGPEY